ITTSCKEIIAIYFLIWRGHNLEDDLFIFLALRFALKHCFPYFARVLSFDGYSYGFALKHFYAQKGR
ncbi:MAG: hypothetical protein ACOVQD_16260, partial [Planktothrix agardhii]|uniref:hypothetical protein n=1 Tax=Planktothrix agardhii TaxID=1160 RepID=UPI003B9C1414